MVLIVNLKALMVAKSAKTGRRLSYADIMRETGIRESTLSRIANDTKYNVSREHIEKLCRYFGCTPNDLITIVQDDDEPAEPVANQGRAE